MDRKPATLHKRDVENIVMIKPIVLTQEKKPRLHQSEYLPAAVKGRGQNIVGAIREYVTSSAVMGNGDQNIFSVTTTATNKELIIVSVEWGVYAGTITNANLLPGGPSVDESQWQIIPVVNSAIVPSTGSQTEEYENCVMIYVRNISAGTTTVNARFRTKQVINYSNPSAS